MFCLFQNGCKRRKVDLEYPEFLLLHSASDRNSPQEARIVLLNRNNMVGCFFGARWLGSVRLLGRVVALLLFLTGGSLSSDYLCYHFALRRRRFGCILSRLGDFCAGGLLLSLSLGPRFQLGLAPLHCLPRLGLSCSWLRRPSTARQY